MYRADFRGACQEYSVRPNIKGSGYWTRGTGAESSIQIASDGAIEIKTEGVTQSAPYTGHPLAGDMRLLLDASKSSSLYQNDLSEVRVNGLFGLNLIRAF